jgi:thioester reductase-like protein
LMEVNLGIKDNDLQKLTNETEILYHVAADVRFDENLTDAILANARGDLFYYTK